MPYVEGKMTILGNATNGILNIPLPIRGKGGLVLAKGEAIDIEQALSKEKIRSWLSELERIEGLGYIKWFAKGTKPTKEQIVPKPKWTPSRVGTTVAPPNQFDKKLNQLLEEEKRRDERTLPGDLGRVTDESYASMGSNVDPAEARAQAIKEAELAQKESELAERERLVNERETRASKRGRKPKVQSADTQESEKTDEAQTDAGENKE